MPVTNTYKDQLGREVSIPYPPRRIISLVPSQTELLYDLGLNEEVIGITKFCIHPDEWFRTKTRIGGTKTLHLEQILALQPDLVIANKEENTKEQVEYLMQHVPVWVSDIWQLGDVRNMIRNIGEITGKSERADEIAGNILFGFKGLIDEVQQQEEDLLRTAYFIWREPWMVAGGGTFISIMMRHCGLENVFEDMPRYPEIALEQLRTADCELILLSSEPYPFKEKHIAELQAVRPDVRIELVDGEMFSWYGSRLLKSVPYFRELRERLKNTDRIPRSD
ncbi:ABC transporter substrate-binding protein [Chitinophaga filiformis]|uniref:ABC-type Fe3+-hydroxamate transport system, substrate-binding protein n=1 Tax=Chitinophaga filiformis TaxID=104663 RepID=A0A1G7YY25_CHIFI|nr:helical backbone metal receptor [Chitinophaga filiformis]SDH01462.1 ABC-type Fe3+-hydroxamate transport system, substrate-binding protein [Chitinophaga filiformis]